MLQFGKLIVKGGQLAKIKNNSQKVLYMILDMQSIYIGYLDQANKANKKHNQIRSYVLGQK